MRTNRCLLFFCFYLIFSETVLSASNSNVEFSDEPNDLASGRKVSATIITERRGQFGQASAAALYAVCFTNSSSLVVAITANETIFPSQSQSPGWTIGRMDTRIRYKFDTDNDGTDAIWYTDGKYKLVRSPDEGVSFARRIGTASKLAALIGESEIRVNFDLSGAQGPISKVLSACGYDEEKTHSNDVLKGGSTRVGVGENRQSGSLFDVQKQLKDFGYDVGVVDGILGQRTKTALVAFQRDNGLPETGVADTLTWQQLRINFKSPKNSPDSSIGFARTVELRRYTQAIQSRVINSWIKPSNLPANINCTVNVTQDETGNVRNVIVAECSGGGNLMQRSVEQAVWRASPLPRPRDPDLFDRQLRMRFKF